MLVSFNSTNDPFHEANVTPDVPTYRLADIGLFRRLMQRTGTGAPVTTRQLAKAAGIAHGTVGNLLTGVKEEADETTARALAHRLGVDLLVVFEPVCRATTSVAEYTALNQPVREVSA
jgi:transcriptional regulator with XRE-family HTH domain